MSITYRELSINLDGIKPEYHHEFKGKKHWFALDSKNNILAECETLEGCKRYIKEEIK